MRSAIENDKLGSLIEAFFHVIFTQRSRMHVRYEITGCLYHVNSPLRLLYSPLLFTKVQGGDEVPAIGCCVTSLSTDLAIIPNRTGLPLFARVRVHLKMSRLMPSTRFHFSVWYSIQCPSLSKHPNAWRSCSSSPSVSGLSQIASPWSLMHIISFLGSNRYGTVGRKHLTSPSHSLDFHGNSLPGFSLSPVRLVTVHPYLYSFRLHAWMLSTIRPKRKVFLNGLSNTSPQHTPREPGRSIVGWSGVVGGVWIPSDPPLNLADFLVHKF